MITIRHFKKEEKELFFNIYKQAIEESFPEYSKNIKNFFRKDNQIKVELGRYLILGAFDEENLIGFINADKPWGGVMFIVWLAVLKEHQHKGIGSLLLKEVEKIALKEGVHSLHLESDEINVEFYKRNGFEIISLDVKGYFGTDNFALKKLIRVPKEENFLK